MSGHVFVVRGDLRRIACDAWLMPCGHACSPERYWLLEDDPDPRPNPIPDDWYEGRSRTTKANWPAGRSQPWLTDVGGGLGTPIEWYCAGAREFLDAAAADVSAPRNRRDRALLALPAVGTNRGGAWHRAGSLIRALLQMLYEVVAEHDVDVALVCYDGPTFAAAQAERRRLEPEWDIHPRLLPRANELARLASKGDLVLFVGAGVSVGAGLPTWKELLAQLGSRASLTSEEQSALENLDVLDQARVIVQRMGSRERLDEAIVEMMWGRQYGLAHALLADLPVSEIVTTNYDLLLEDASIGAGRRIACLPYGATADSDRWILKMHGCITRPEDIVLTREDYIRYSERRAALAGIVQALLITRHMLFIGFSLEDDNFHRIADAVRVAVPDADDRMGTALMLFDQPLLAELWAPDLDQAVFADEGDGIAAAARKLEIFLDFVLAHTTDTAVHLLNDRYVGQLTSPEHELREVLIGLRAALLGLSDEARAHPLWQTLLDFVDGFAHEEDLPGRRRRP